jgi:hypothetical protein
VRAVRRCPQWLHALQGGSRFIDPSAPNEELDTLLQTRRRQLCPTTPFAERLALCEQKQREIALSAMSRDPCEQRVDEYGSLRRVPHAHEWQSALRQPLGLRQRTLLVKDLGENSDRQRPGGNGVRPLVGHQGQCIPCQPARETESKLL